MRRMFSLLYDPLMAPLEKGRFMHIRRNLLQSEQGRILEIGSGTGINFPFYQEAESVIAIEPDPYLQTKSLKRMKQACVPIRLVEASGEQLPFDDDTFDTVVFTLVLCTINDPKAALEEAKRVLKSEGRMIFLEHVRMPSRPAAWLQDILTPFWKKLCDGCRLNRQTLKLINDVGFEITQLRTDYKGLFISGTAKKGQLK